MNILGGRGGGVKPSARMVDRHYFLAFYSLIDPKGGNDHVEIPNIYASLRSFAVTSHL